MKFSDQELSAFLDAELDELKMQAIRNALVDDENLAIRLAELAEVDELIKAEYSQINHLPLPDSIRALIAEDKDKTAKVSFLPSWLNRQSSIAASVALIAGFLVADMLPSQNNVNSPWQAQVQVLNSNLSGDAVIDAQGRQIIPVLSFINQQKQLCRQYEVIYQDQRSQHLACRSQTGWQQKISEFALPLKNEDEYATASGQSDIMRQAIAQMASGGILNKDEEAEKLNP